MNVLEKALESVWASDMSNALWNQLREGEWYDPTPAALAAAGYRIERGKPDDGDDLAGMYWWTLSVPGWSNVVVSEEVWHSSDGAIKNACYDAAHALVTTVMVRPESAPSADFEDQPMTKSRMRRHIKVLERMLNHKVNTLTTVNAENPHAAILTFMNREVRALHTAIRILRVVRDNNMGEGIEAAERAARAAAGARMDP